jgi:probable phosphoglycerate mutase
MKQMMTKIIALRHGETQWNSIGKQQGHLNSDLTDTGVKQAEAAAEALGNFSFDYFYSSDLGRAIQTSMIISETVHKEFITDIHLRERHLGILQGLTMLEFEQLHPEEAKRFREYDPDYRIPGGESIRDRYDRSIRCIENLARRHHGSTLLIVSHGGILASMFQKATNMPLTQRRAFSLLNMSLNVFTISQTGEWFLEIWGDICHLKNRGLATIDDF